MPKTKEGQELLAGVLAFRSLVKDHGLYQVMNMLRELDLNFYYDLCTTEKHCEKKIPAVLKG